MGKRGKEPVFTLTIDVFADGSTQSRSYQPVDEFWEVRKAMIGARNQLDEDIRNGPQTCPFRPGATASPDATRDTGSAP